MHTPLWKAPPTLLPKVLSFEFSPNSFHVTQPIWSLEKMETPPIDPTPHITNGQGIEIDAHILIATYITNLQAS